MRTEKDFLGEMQIPDNALFGIHSARAKSNFYNESKFHIEWYKAVGLVKQACFTTITNFINAVDKKHPEKLEKLKIADKAIYEQLHSSAIKVSKGEFFDNFIVPAMQGGAGTSINMNINEIITNTSLIELGKLPGDYETIDPIEDTNLYQSTNDVIPTALTIATIQLLEKLEHAINKMRQQLEKLEQEHRNTLRLGYTQMQAAVPSSFGLFFGAFNDAFSRDWWRISKCFERIKVVNLGGGAIGTGIAIPRFYIMEVVAELKKLTGLPITQSENLSETTSNLDSFVEVHGMLNAQAVNLKKMVNDIRLLASDINGNEIIIPAKQVGSSIMPGKVNPVIIEHVDAICEKVFSNQNLITNLSAQGTLELNANIPLTGHALLESIKLLINANNAIETSILNELKINSKQAEQKLYLSPAVCTAISPAIGYNKASELAKYMKEFNCNIFEANEQLCLIESSLLEEYMQPGFLLQKGFSVKEI